METREVYFKILVESDLPFGRIGYVYKDSKNTIQIGSAIALDLSTDVDIANRSIEKMKEVENTPGFMFWNNSLEGELFFKENSKVIGNILANMIINQK